MAVLIIYKNKADLRELQNKNGIYYKIYHIRPFSGLGKEYYNNG